MFYFASRMTCSRHLGNAGFAKPNYGRNTYLMRDRYRSNFMKNNYLLNFFPLYSLKIRNGIAINKT